MRFPSALFLILLLSLLHPGVAAAGGAEEGQGKSAAGQAPSAIPEEIPLIEPARLTDGESLRIVATTDILGEVVQRVAAGAAAVYTLIPQGQNPHAYQATPSALREVERAHLVFVNGFGLEEAVLADVRAVANGYIVPVSVGISPLRSRVSHAHHEDEGENVAAVSDDAGDGDADHDEGEHDDEDHDDPGHDEAADPHVWMDPNNVVVWVDNIADALGSIDPARRDVYRDNAESYKSELAEADSYIRLRVSQLAPEKRKLVVDHESFSYFANRYGFELVGAVVPGTSDVSEPSAREVAGLADVMDAEGVTNIFVGVTASRAIRDLARAVAAETEGGARVHEVLTGSLAPAGMPGDTYIGFLRYNVDRIVTALME